MSRVLALILALAAWVCSGVALLLGLVWGLGLKCDESCDDGGGWKNNPDAWQWYGVAGLGVLSFVAGSAFVVFVWRRKPLAATVAVVVGFAAAAALLNPLSSEWIDHLDRRSPGELLLMVSAVFAPILALLLSVEPRRRRL
jgi:hypothetical protein